MNQKFMTFKYLGKRAACTNAIFSVNWHQTIISVAATNTENYALNNVLAWEFPSWFKISEKDAFLFKEFS